MCDLHRGVPVEPTGSWLKFGGKTGASDSASRRILKNVPHKTNDQAHPGVRHSSSTSSSAWRRSQTSAMGKSSDCHNEKSSDRSIQPELRMTKSKMSALLPDPDFSCSPPECVFAAGVRPYRKKTYRLEAKNLGTKFVVHNYGHGGAGITMSWGCAAAVRDIRGRS